VDQTVGRQYQVAPANGRSGFAQRLAYLIDPEGVIRQAYQVTDLPGFAGQVLADLRARQPGWRGG
jgi:peroxiredoxin